MIRECGDYGADPDCLYGQAEDYLALKQAKKAKEKFLEAAQEYDSCGKASDAEKARKRAAQIK